MGKIKWGSSSKDLTLADGSLEASGAGAVVEGVRSDAAGTAVQAGVKGSCTGVAGAGVDEVGFHVCPGAVVDSGAEVIGPAEVHIRDL